MDRVYILAGCQISGGRSKVGSNFPRKIGKGMPHILGFLERGCRKVGADIFVTAAPMWDTHCITHIGALERIQIFSVRSYYK